MAEGLGHARRRLINKIIQTTWRIEDPDSKTYSFRDVLWIIQEMTSDEGIKYLQQQTTDRHGQKYQTFKAFVEHLFYRNIANYDSMILLTSDKGCITDDSLIMMPRDIKKYPEGVPIKDLIGKGPIWVYSFNKETKQLEIKKSDGVKLVKEDNVYEVELTTGEKIKATDDHPFLLMDGSYKQLKDLVWFEKIKNLGKNPSYSRYRIGMDWHYTDRIRMVIPKQESNETLKINYDASEKLKTSETREIEHRFIYSQINGELNSKEIIHHIDENHFNNDPSNLIKMSSKEHIEHHLSEYFFKEGNDFCKATGYSTHKKNKIINGSKEFKEMVSNQRITYFKNKDNVEKYKEIMKVNGSKTNMYRYGGIIKNIQHIGIRKVYDVINVRDNHNFIANGFVLKNSGKSSAAIMMARYWCILLGIRFNPARHMAYSNKDVNDKIDILSRYEPLVCLSGDTKIAVKIVKKIFGFKYYEYFTYKNIKNLVNRNDYEVATYNLEKDENEWKKPLKTVLTKKNAEIYKLEYDTYNSKLGELKATSDHLILTTKGYVKIKDLDPKKDILVYKDELCEAHVGIRNITKLTNKEDVYDIIGVPDNHNFVANNIVVHNCDEAIRFASAAEWAKRENKELKKKLAQVRTKHLLFILCFPLKVAKLEKTYLECLSGDTIIKTEEGNIKIKELEGRTNFKVYSYNEKTKQIELRVAEKCVKTKIDYVWKVEFDNNTFVEATEDHLFLTGNGWKKLKQLKPNIDRILNKDKKLNKIISITKGDSKEVYDILNVEHNYNYVANNLILHNSFVNYWIDLFGRGLGAIYVKDKNPANDSWRLKEFKDVGSYTEFTSLENVEKMLKKHPNFWKLIRFPKPPEWLYTKYLEVREKNVYNEQTVMDTVSVEDIHNALLIMSLQDVMASDSNLNIDRISLHIKNQYSIPITKQNIRDRILDAKQLVTKIREDIIS